MQIIDHKYVHTDFERKKLKTKIMIVVHSIDHSKKYIEIHTEIYIQKCFTPAAN